MLSNTLQTIVEAAVNAELIDTKRAYGDHYASPHEGYGVLMEELHEATVELRDLDNTIHIPLMDGLHENDPEAMIDALSVVELDARRLAYEAIQVAAVARKLSETSAAMMAAPPPKVPEAPCHINSALEDKSPVQRFLLVLRELLDEGNKLLDLRDAFPTDYIPAYYMGFHDRDRFYIFPQRIYDKVEEVLQARGLSLGVSCKKLCQMLRDKKIVIPDGSYPCKVKHVGGKSYRLLWIPKQVVREADGRG